ncbi:MAG: hypothetical protein J0L75_13840 [Spirochaetes bacterium]|nr:hypothetical protein [Spirochaetota bacterium]
MALSDDEARRLMKVKIAHFRLKIARLRAKRVQVLVRLAKAEAARKAPQSAESGGIGAAP